MPKIVTLALLLLLSACAKPWPAAVASYSGFSASEREAIEAAVVKLNERAGSELVLLKEDTARFSLHFALDGRHASENVGGEADVGASSCTIALSPRVFRRDLLETVVWHEVGHCGGLDHASAPGEVMSPEVSSFRNYPAERLEHFLQALRRSTGLNLAK